MSQPTGSPPRAQAPGEPALSLVVLAFAAIYLVWGSTYLAIRWAVETMPPLSMAAARFLVAGGAAYAWSLSRGDERPSPRQWRDAAVAGTLLLAFGNGAVVVAEQWVPSGLTALLVGSVPLWLVVLDALFGSRGRPSPRAGVGLMVGFGGLVLLAGSPGVGAGGVHELGGALLVLFGAFAWAAGSLYSRHASTPPRARTWVGMQMLAGGAALTLLAVASGEVATLDPSAVSVRSWLSFAYLIVFGALIGYAAYIWLLRVSTPARVGTYAYVNPVVALLLGWSLAGERLTFRSVLAATIIVASVIAITSEGGGRREAGRAGGGPLEQAKSRGGMGR
jgi:drug/metabolite transporter (DMT)-like permease